MLSPIYSPHFRHDVKKCERRGKDMKKLDAAIALLLEQAHLPAQERDHELKGTWKHHRELHLEPDWLLVYKVEGGYCTFERTGRHSDIFGE